MSLALLGLGTALAPHAASQDEALALALELWPYTAAQRRLLPQLYRRTGVERRRTVLELPHGAPLRRVTAGDAASVPGTAERQRAYAVHAPPLACAAGAAALRDAAVDPEAVSHLVTVSCTGAGAPGLDIALLGALQLRPDVQRTHVGFMGCQGALAGLRVARAFADADADARVLVVAVELCSLHFHYGWDPEKVVANALFADGAAALLGARAAPDAAGPPGGQASAGPRGGPEARDAPWRLTASGSCLLPDSREAMTWTVGDHGFLMTLSARVPALIEARLRGWLDPWLAGQGLARADVASWAVHPGGPRILDAVERALELPDGATAASRAVLAEHGNMSSPTVLFILDRLRAAGAARPCVALGFGPGLVVEAALLR